MAKEWKKWIDKVLEKVVYKCKCIHLLKTLVQNYVENVGRQVFWKTVLTNLMEFFFRNNQAHKFCLKIVEIIGLPNLMEKWVDNFVRNWVNNIVEHSCCKFVERFGGKVG